MTCYELSGEKLNQLQLQFKDITHIIIDEYSMVSQGLFAQIDSRLPDKQPARKNYSLEV